MDPGTKAARAGPDSRQLDSPRTGGGRRSGGQSGPAGHQIHVPAGRTNHRREPGGSNIEPGRGETIVDPAQRR